MFMNASCCNRELNLCMGGIIYCSKRTVVYITVPFCLVLLCSGNVNRNINERSERSEVLCQCMDGIGIETLSVHSGTLIHVDLSLI